MNSLGSQIVYVLTNPAMPALVKIGKTTRQEVEVRMKELYGTGVPFPFECAFACQVKDAKKVEDALHLAFGGQRVNPNREFFRIEPERVIAILKLLKVDDITAKFEKQLETESDVLDKQAGAAFKKLRHPRMDFSALAIPTGATLLFKDGVTQCTVVDERYVQHGEKISLLTPLTREVLGLAPDAVLQPSPYWTYNGKTIKEIYEAVYAESDEL